MKRSITIPLTSLFMMLVPLALHAVTTTGSLPQETATQPRTLQLNSWSVVRTAPDGLIVDVWDAGTLFTSRSASGHWLRISGHFPGERSWQAASETLWIDQRYVREVERHYVKPKPRPKGLSRRIVVDKSDFKLKVYERFHDEEKEIFSTSVALGMDRCMPQEKGGKCYYTDPGEYKVRWKVYDPEGIEWCIPKSMEEEFADDIAAGKRCFTGAIGKHALNIGKSYAIHGTSNPASLGTKASHGCVRTDNGAMETIFELMEVDDEVVIVD